MNGRAPLGTCAFILGMLAASLNACGNETGRETATSAADVNGVWNAVELLSEPIDKAADPKSTELVVTNLDTWQAGDGCEHVQGTLSVSQEGGFLARAVTEADVDCSASTQPRTANIEVVTRATSWRIDARHLYLIGNNGEPLAEYERSR